MRWNRRILSRGGSWLLWLLVALVGCHHSRPAPEAENHVVLQVAAASDLRAVLPVLIETFGKTERAVEVVPVFGASGQLAEQVKAGAPFDVFLSANRAYVDRLTAAGAIEPGSARPYAIGSLVLAARRGGAVPIKNLADLTRPDVKAVALANPETAPYGAAARQALERAGLWETLRPKLVIAGSVRQALAHVESGDAEAGLVGRSDANQAGVEWVLVDRSGYDPLVQALGVVARTSHPREAESFARFLLSEAGQQVFKLHGYQSPVVP